MAEVANRDLRNLVSATGVKEHLPSAPGITVAPNPVRDQVTVRFDQNIDGMLNYKLISMDGRQVLSGEQFSNDGKMDLQLPILSLKDGIYVLFINSDDKVFKTKLMVNHN